MLCERKGDVSMNRELNAVQRLIDKESSWREKDPAIKLDVGGDG